MTTWLDRNKLTGVFKSISVNESSEQPHLYKERIINKINPDIYIEDNLDIVLYLADRVKTKVWWIYNFIDREYKYRYKFPYLEAGLKSLNENTN